jgi:hypothetical protein
MQGSMNAQTLFETEDLETTCRVWQTMHAHVCVAMVLGLSYATQLKNICDNMAHYPYF